MSEIEKVLQEVDDYQSSSVQQLLELIAIPSISSEPASGAGISQAASWLKKCLQAIGLKAEVIETDGHPIVLAHSQEAGRGKRHRLLLYGHYDVQPVGDVAEWDHPPFAPQVIEEGGVHRFYGRGASDSKSQLWSFIQALRAFKTATGTFPADVTVMLEGEEESGSASLPAFIDAHRKELACDVAFICDSDMWSASQPAITTQLKGLLHERLTISTPNPDLHSGFFGAVAANPVRILCGILAAMHDAEGRVAIDGFYDDVIDMPDQQRREWQALSRETDLFAEIDLRGGVLEKGYSEFEAMWGRPTVDINGITGGNQGPGERSVLPGTATARISFRLVAAQKPEHVRECFRRFVRSRLPSGCTAEFHGEGGSSAVVLSKDSPYLNATARGLEAEWRRPVVLKGTGGSIPLIELFGEKLGVECILIGFILGTDAIHAPNEHYDTERLAKGVRSWIHILDYIRRMP